MNVPFGNISTLVFANNPPSNSPSNETDAQSLDSRQKNLQMLLMLSDSDKSDGLGKYTITIL